MKFIFFGKNKFVKFLQAYLLVWDDLLVAGELVSEAGQVKLVVKASCFVLSSSKCPVV